jgi:hypothetical protein
MKPETETLKNLFRAYAAQIEKVANEILEPSTLTRVQVPPEVIDYWLSHIELVMEVDAKSLLGKDTRNLTEHQKAVEEAAGMPLDWGMVATYEAGKKS